MTPDQQYEQLANTSFGDEIWNCTALLDKSPETWAGTANTMIANAWMITGLLVAFQIIIITVNIAKSQGNFWYNVSPLIFKLIILTAFVNPITYSLLVKGVFGNICDAIANNITMTYIDSYLDQVELFMGKTSEAPNKPVAILTSVIDGSLFHRVIAALIYAVAAIMMFVTSMIQPYIFTFLYLIGPFCIIFSLNDFTFSVLKNWISAILMTGFAGIFGSIAFLICSRAGLVESLANGAGWDNSLIVIIYGACAVAFYAMIWPISSFLFGGLASLGGAAAAGAAIMQTTKAVTGTGASTMQMAGATGAVASVMGAAFQRFGGNNGAMASIGKGMSDMGASMMRSFDYAQGISGYNTQASVTKDLANHLTQKAGGKNFKGSMPDAKVVNKENPNKNSSDKKDV